MRLLKFGLGAVIVAGLAWLAFANLGNSTRISNDHPLQFVPADTPYVYAMLEPAPENISKRWVATLDSEISGFRAHIADMLTLIEGIQDHDVDDETQNDSVENPLIQHLAPPNLALWLKAMDGELASISTGEELLKRVGIDHSSMAAIYGIGLVPVTRIQLSDTLAFPALIARLEKNSKQTLRKLNLANAQGWVIESEDFPLAGILAIVGNHLVITVAPREDESVLSTLLGLTPPSHSVAQSKTLETLNDAEGFMPYGSGYMDTARLLAQFQTPATPIESAFLSAFDTEKPMFGNACAEDIATFSKHFPRLTSGYTRFDDKFIDMLSRIETSEVISERLMPLSTDLIGWETARHSLVSVGLAIKALELPTLAGHYQSAVRTSPWQCKELQWLNDSAASIVTAANSPAVYASAPVLSSVVASLEHFDLDIAEFEIKNLASTLVLGSQNPKGILSSLGMFLPEFNKLNLTPSAPAQPIHSDTLKELGDIPAYVAMENDALGISLGAGTDAHLKKHLTSKNAKHLFALQYHSEFYAQLIGYAREYANGLDDSNEKTMILNEIEKIENLNYMALIKRMEVTMSLEKRGIVFRQSIELN